MVLENRNKSTMTNFQQWLLGVQRNPILLRKNVKSVCDLIWDSNASQTVKYRLTVKYQLCLTSTKKYYESFSISKCPDCRNAGKKLNINGRCECACRSSFYGQMCQNQWGGKSAERSNYTLGLMFA